MQGLLALQDAALRQRGHLMGWVPVCLGTGIGLYFLVPVEPGPLAYAGLVAIAVLALVIARRIGPAASPLMVALALVAGGALLAGARSHYVAEPVLGYRYYGAIEGRVVSIDRSVSDAPRLTLDRVVLERMSPARTPARVRVSVHADGPLALPEPGTVVILTGHLGPPSGPVEPGGFDFQRNAWFERLGAVGYTRTPVLVLAPAQEGAAGLWVDRQRAAISAGVQALLPGETGAFAAALMTGDRSGMGQATLAALRASNLAHLLAISGLHMGLLTAFVFGVLRYGLALIPPFALRLPVKKFAAFAALLVAAAYLALSGGNVATERAFVQVAVMLVAVMLDRRALTLRSVAIAALIVLLMRPEALMGPGFQMSFAATTALVAVFGWITGVARDRVPRWLRPTLGVVLSSLVAGLATAPFAAAHFNQISHYGLIANLLSVPLMGVLVMPAAVIAACLAPFGLAWVGLWIMEIGLRWILWVAHGVAGLDGAVGHVVTPGNWVLPLLALGALWLVLWQGRARLVGVVPVALALVLWSGAGRPALLVADSGALIGVMGPQGRALNKPRGDGFVAGSWLENDGAPVGQETAAQRDGLLRGDRRTEAVVGGLRIVQIAGDRALAAIKGCDGADILIVTVADPVTRPCEVYDIDRLRQTGALAGWTGGDGLRIVSAREVTGDRIWSGRRGPADIAVAANDG